MEPSTYAGTDVAAKSAMRYWLIALLVGCAGANIEDQITIDQGVYGLLSDSTDRPAANEVVLVFQAGENGIHARATSTHDGVYQIDLAAGDYTLCIESCTSITVPYASTVRYDWTNG